MLRSLASMQRLALITGASSGIGKDLAYIHAERLGDLILAARRTDLLESIKKDIEHKFSRQVICISKDLRDPNAAQEIYNEVTKLGYQVEYLMKLTKLFLPSMLKHGFGRILNTSSVAAFVPGPLQANYYATKAYVQSLTNAINAELEDQSADVRLTALCPGPTVTEFAEVADVKDI